MRLLGSNFTGLLSNLAVWLLGTAPEVRGSRRRHEERYSTFKSHAGGWRMQPARSTLSPSSSADGVDCKVEKCVTPLSGFRAQLLQLLWQCIAETKSEFLDLDFKADSFSLAFLYPSSSKWIRKGPAMQVPRACRALCRRGGLRTNSTAHRQGRVFARGRFAM